MDENIIDINGAVLMAKFISKRNPSILKEIFDEIDIDLFEDSWEYISGAAKYVGYSNITDDQLDYLVAFYLKNKNLIVDNNFNADEYLIPKMKTYVVNGSVVETAVIKETYQIISKSYSPKTIEYYIKNHEIFLSDGKLLKSETIDYPYTDDYEVIIHSIIEKKK